ncbi:hypothetical protein [Microbulbifer sp. VAAF005]|uniref:hypothetical protein n=1 Tax=Microbulbifer sp. VAAF005 TaxID=3034230 RepID=UPI0024AD212B|nr:hypothetical protein [Microbulbifer sp. VAAF005]WHI46562.1 hypothetical protein P0078_23125 [Microbulbifer sp. VAAF005]
MSENLSIWQRVKKTDARFVKESTVEGRKTASINHIAMVEKATEIWGPIGIGWGYEIIEERDDQGAPVILEGQEIGRNLTHTIRLRLWYKIDGERGHVENYGHTPRIYWSHKNKYFVEDKEAAKKSLSDALKKCFSFLGFSADIYSGEWDDPEYRQERQLESQIDKAEDKDSARDKQTKELTEYVQKHLKTLKSSRRLHEAAGIFKTSIKHLERQRNMPHLTDVANKGITVLTQTYEAQKEQLQGAA